jgi:hypothetical protein
LRVFTYLAVPPDYFPKKFTPSIKDPEVHPRLMLVAKGMRPAFLTLDLLAFSI